MKLGNLYNNSVLELKKARQKVTGTPQKNTQKSSDDEMKMSSIKINPISHSDKKRIIP